MSKKTVRTTEPLTTEDLYELAVARRGVRKVFFIVFPVNVFLAWLCFSILWLAVLFMLIALVMTLVLVYSESRFKKDTGDGVKYILVGPVQPLITIEGGTVRAEVDRQQQRLKTFVVKGASEKQYDEPFVLSTGQKDRFFYALRTGDTQVMVDRAIFLDFQAGEMARLEITPPGTLIRCSKIS